MLGLTAPGAKPDQGFPGQDLVKPGEFVLGPYLNELGGQSTPPLPWMANGAYMVFRRLSQDVPGFNAYMTANAAPGEAPRLAARLVGRWKDGSPVVLAPDAPDPTLDPSHPETNNDFEFGAEDPHQEKCPFASHIRKVYPRKDLDPESERHRILRAGIPFGADEDADKGLLFVCYQASIVDKFEFIQHNWANNSRFVPGQTTVQGTPILEPGHDFIIGQPGPRQAVLTSNDGKPERLDGAAQFVTCTGAVYFFTPSRSALLAIAQG